MHVHERRERPSEIAHVLFREEDGWTPDEARRWLDRNGLDRYGDAEIVESQGGEKLVPGTYISYRTAPEDSGFTSYGYGDEAGDGIWFKFGGFRRRRDGEAAPFAAADHLGPSGRYFVDYVALGEVEIAGPFSTEDEAWAAADQIGINGHHIEAVYEADPSGQTFVLDGGDGAAYAGSEDRPAPTGEEFDAALDRFLRLAQEMLDRHGVGMAHIETYRLVPEAGPRYVRIVREVHVVPSGELISRSAWAFVDKRTGDILKPHGWKGPAKHARGNIFSENPIAGVGPYGAQYLR